MMDQANKELVQAGVDGELSADEQAALQALLSESEEARELHRELGKLNDLLDSVPALELPNGLHARIVEQSDLPRQSWFKSLLGNLTVMPVLRYGFAAVLGLLVGLSIFENRDFMHSADDYSNMVGTISSGSRTMPGDVLASMIIADESISGQVQLSLDNDLYLLELELDSPDSVDFNIDLSAGPFEFNALANKYSGLDVISVDQSVIQATGQGNVKLLVMLEKTGEITRGEEQGIALSIRQDGTQIKAGWLAPGK